MLMSSAVMRDAMTFAPMLAAFLGLLAAPLLASCLAFSRDPSYGSSIFVPSGGMLAGGF